jgi:hypothetical protein
MYVRYINYKKCLSHCSPRQNQLPKFKWHRGTEGSHIASIALDKFLSCVLRHQEFVILLDKETLPPAFCTTLFRCFVRGFFSQNGCFRKLRRSNHKTNIQKKTTKCLQITICSLNTSGNTYISNRLPEPKFKYTYRVSGAVTITSITYLVKKVLIKKQIPRYKW